MNLVGLIFGSSIGRKILMAATGLVLVGFVTGHLVGNLQIFAHPDKINGYAHFLQSLGPALWGIRLFLLACVAIHVWAAVDLVLENRAARGPEAYGVSKWLNAILASRYMKHTGIVVLAFIIYHLAHFTVGTAQSATFKAALPEYAMKGDFHLLGFPIVAKGQAVHDVYSMVYLGFAHPVVSLFYIVAVALLSLHLLHGVDSMFQTFGLRNHKWCGCLRRVVVVYCLAYFLGNLAIPGAILAGVAKPAAGTTAAKKVAALSVPPSHLAQR
jgi:succinate dehydrogenase / fumarate reductase cytochrome b subunit